jgi:tRNA G18 (ribose-2'-O)-methylase SpoU
MSKRTQTKSRGYCGIGIENPKTITNLGTLWRSAYCLGADFIFTIGDRYHKQSSDTVKAYRHIPYFRYKDIDDFKEHIPYDCQVVGVELLDCAAPLESFCHPQRAIYLLGKEDGDLSKKAIELCQHIVKFSSKHCLNVSSAGTVVLYDRQVKTH